MKKIVIILLLLGVLFMAGCKVPLVESPEDVRECIYDVDCIKVPTSCCGCDVGGEEQCISVAAKPLYNDLIKDCPKNSICTETNNCNIQNCSCQNNKCVANFKR